MNTLRTLFLISGLLICLASAQADDVLTVNNVTLPQNGEVALEIKGTFDTDFTMFELEIELAEGITLKLNNNGRPWAELGGTGTDHTITSSTPLENTFKFVCSSMSQSTLPESEVLMRVTVQPSEELEVGTVLNGTIKNILFNEHTSSGNIGHNFNNIPFTVTIDKPDDGRILLDETGTEVPADASNVNVRIKRTIKANEWSTLCLPFAMTAEQITAAFSPGTVHLGDFTGVETETDAEENIIGITVNFSDVTAIEANHPYIIKVSNISNDITEFTVDNVNIQATDELSVDCDENKVKISGKYYYFYNSFKGTYVANTVLEKNMLFLSGNKFWYSNGSTKMKAFRGYFDFYDILTELEDAGARIGMSFDDETTDLKHVTFNMKYDNGEWYTLDGRKLDKKPTAKGVYVKDGRKVVIK